MVQPTLDGRLFGHFPYPDTPATLLADAPLSPGGSCKVHPAMLPDLNRLLAAAAADPAVGNTLRAVSCHRTEALQRQTFCSGIGPDGSGSFAERAWASAPPGHSEHATGYVIDFGATNARACDAEACFAASTAGRWLRANAARFGFEMSFPAGNRQQVKWEPWHWRWVGTAATAPGAGAPRTLFAAARSRFPADPRPVD
jgi:D-alanyl-D-alanine carboxypeptidase